MKLYFAFIFIAQNVFCNETLALVQIRDMTLKLINRQMPLPVGIQV